MHTSPPSRSCKVQPGAKEGEKGSGPDSTLPAPLPCSTPSWTKAERAIQYNTYIFHYEIAISFPAFYFMHPELYASFYITPEGWWVGLGSFSCEAVALPGSSPQDAPAADVAGPKHDSHSSLSPAPAAPYPSSKGSLCPGSQGSPSPCTWFLSADPWTSPSCSQQLWMGREQQLNPDPAGVGRSKPEEGGAGTVQHAHGAVTPGPRLPHSRARPARGSRGCSPRVKFYQRSGPVEQGAPSGGWVTGQELSSLEPVQSRVSGGRRNNPALPVHPQSVTLSGCTRCCSWQKCQTRAGGCRGGSGLVCISSGEWSTGSGWLVWSQCAVGSQRLSRVGARR